MLNTLLLENYTEMPHQQRTELESSQLLEELDNRTPSSQFEKENAVHSWSVDDVVTWLQSDVKFQGKHMEVCSKAFQDEGIDGLRLLALQRSNRACANLTDAEWLQLFSARENLLASDGRTGVPSESHSSSPLSSPRTPKEAAAGAVSAQKSSRLHTSKSLTVRPAQKSGLLKSSMRYLSFSPRYWWSSSSTKYEQKIPPVATEVDSLHEEIHSAEEREAELKAKLEHLDEILRTAKLACYLYTRMRWTPLPGELPVDDKDIDDWLQRFLVLEGSTIFFYPQAADLRPEGAILFSEILDVGAISGEIENEQGSIRWFGFHITTCDGLRLECATSLKLQADLWLSSIQCALVEQQSKQAVDGSL